MTDAVRTERHGAVLEIVLDRPRANAIDGPTSRALGAAFDAFQADPALRVAILTGAGERIFSAGWDLASAGSGDFDWGSGGWGGLCRRLDLDKPVIAAVNGACAAGGFEIALACDLIVAADHAVFFLSEATLGLTVDVGSIPRLFQRLPHALAVEMLYTGRRIGAAEAAAHGLACRVVPQAELMATARALADAIVESAPLSVAAMKQMIDVAAALPVAEAYALKDAGRFDRQARADASEDAMEGPRAFGEKRRPVWKGR